MDGELSTNGLVVAYVDDEPAPRLVAQRLLQVAGYRALTGASGEEAIALRFGDPEPDAMVVNGLMPGMHGDRAIAAIRAREAAEGRRRVPIILESAWEDVAERAERCGADGFLWAGWRREDLFESLEALLARGRGDDL